MGGLIRGGIEGEIVDDEQAPSGCARCAVLERDLATVSRLRDDERKSYIFKHEQLYGANQQLLRERQAKDDRILRLELEIRGSPVLTSEKSSIERKLGAALAERDEAQAQLVACVDAHRRVVERLHFELATARADVAAAQADTRAATAERERMGLEVAILRGAKGRALLRA